MSTLSNRIGHAGQTAEISGAYDSTSGAMRIRKFDYGIDALALARSMAPSAVSSMAEITATGQWRINGDGEISAKQPENGQGCRR